jgi:hypothetical protein
MIKNTVKIYVTNQCEFIFLSLAIHLLMALDPLPFYKNLHVKWVQNNTNSTGYIYIRVCVCVIKKLLQELQYYRVSHINAKNYQGTLGIVFLWTTGCCFSTHYPALHIWKIYQLPSTHYSTVSIVYQTIRYILWTPWLTKSSTIMVSVPHLPTVYHTTGHLIRTLLLQSKLYYYCLFSILHTNMPNFSLYSCSYNLR